MTEDEKFEQTLDNIPGIFKIFWSEPEKRKTPQERLKEKDQEIARYKAELRQARRKVAELSKEKNQRSR